MGVVPVSVGGSCTMGVVPIPGNVPGSCTMGVVPVPGNVPVLGNVVCPLSRNDIVI